MSNSKFQIPKSKQAGFTLMEIIVATSIFALAFSCILTLFNYTLKINRKSEALRQASQGMRNFMEFLVKEVRNGQINYGVVNRNPSALWPIGPCTAPSIAPPLTSTYHTPDNRLAIMTTEGDEECIYFGNSSANYAGASTFTAPTNGNYKLVLEKPGGVEEVLSPPN